MPHKSGTHKADYTKCPNNPENLEPTDNYTEYKSRTYKALGLHKMPHKTGTPKAQ